MSRPGPRFRLLDGVDARLMALPARGLAPDGVHNAQVRAAGHVLTALPDAPRTQQRDVLAELLDTLGLNPTKEG